jgi:hypothetical protein
MERLGTGSYLIVAGAFDDGGGFALYRWKGKDDKNPARINIDLGTLPPEALFAIPGTDTVQLISDDGNFWGKKCEDLAPGAAKFRGTVIKP